MNPEAKAQWLTDLRSGNYQQGLGALHKVRRQEDGTERHEFCCLGVLCEGAVAAGKTERIPRDDYGNDTNTGFRYGVKETMEYRDPWWLPDSVREWAGLDSRDPVIVYENEAVSLSSLNDVHHLSFSQIADIVEAQL